MNKKNKEIDLGVLSIIFLFGLASLIGIFIITKNLNDIQDQKIRFQDFVISLNGSEVINKEGMINDFNTENVQYYHNLKVSQSLESYDRSSSLKLEYVSDKGANFQDSAGSLDINLPKKFINQTYLNLWVKRNNDDVSLYMQLRDKKGIIWEPNFLRGLILPKDEWTLIKTPLKDFEVDLTLTKSLLKDFEVEEDFILKSESVKDIILIISGDITKKIDSTIYLDKAYFE